VRFSVVALSCNSLGQVMPSALEATAVWHYRSMCNFNLDTIMLVLFNHFTF